MQIKGRDYQVLYTKESKEVQVAIDLLSMVEHKSSDTLHTTADKSPKGTRTEGRKPLRQVAASACKLYGRGRKWQYAEPRLY